MAENPENRSSTTPTRHPAVQTEKLSFDPGEMVACGSCGRMNPPNRLKCLYCAGELDVKIEDAASIKPVLRKLELWERGYNLILRERAQAPPTAKIADMLSTEPADLVSIIDAGAPLPLARVESEKEAAVLQVQLQPLGLKCSILSDADLAPDNLPTRLRSIDLPGGRIVLHEFNTDKLIEIGTGELALIVKGMITARRVDSLEKKKRGGKTKLIDETATMSDESVLDIYTRRDARGFRIHMAGFDFSCLGEDKGLLAGENMRQLIVVLKQIAPSTILVTNYPSIRHALNSVWEVETRKDPQGLQRSGFGKLEFGNVASTNNLNQFTKYSRLQWHLYEGKG